MPHRSATLRRAEAAVRVRWQLRRLRRALRAGNKLDAVAAAGRIHAIAVRPNLAAGRWPQAQAACERVLSHIPARQAPGYLPGLRGVIECLHADAARAARAAGHLRPAKLHLIALIGYLRDRRAPLGRQVVVLVDLAFVYIAANEARTGRRILADIGSFLAGEYPGARPRPKRLAGRPRRTVAISPPPRCTLFPPLASARPKAASSLVAPPSYLGRRSSVQRPPRASAHGKACPSLPRFCVQDKAAPFCSRSLHHDGDELKLCSGSGKAGGTADDSSARHAG